MHLTSACNVYIMESSRKGGARHEHVRREVQQEHGEKERHFVRQRRGVSGEAGGVDRSSPEPRAGDCAVPAAVPDEQGVRRRLRGQPELRRGQFSPGGRRHEGLQDVSRDVENHCVHGRPDASGEVRGHGRMDTRGVDGIYSLYDAPVRERRVPVHGRPVR